MPFGYYETFGSASVYYDTNYSYSDVYAGAGFASYQYNAPNNANQTYNSYSYSYIRSSVGGNTNDDIFWESNTNGTTNHTLNSGTNSVSVDTGVSTGSFSNSDGTTTSLSRVYKTSFTPYIGFPYTNGTDEGIIYFSSNSDDVGYINLTTTSEITFGSNTDDPYVLVSTTQITKSETILGVNTTWTDVTTEFVSTRRTYTGFSTYTEYPVSIQGFEINPVIEYESEALIIQPQYGLNWTQDGSLLQYLQIFTSTGIYGPTYSEIFKDNTETRSTFLAEKIQISTNAEFSLGITTTYTAISSSVNTVIYDIIDSATSQLTFSTSYSFDGVQFQTNSDFITSVSFNKAVKTSSSFTELIQNEYLIDGLIEGTDYKYGIYTATKAIQASTTDTFYGLDGYGSYFSFFTYRGIIKTTTQQEYVLYDAGTYGTFTSSSSTSSSNFVTGEDGLGGSYTNNGSYSSTFAGGLSQYPHKKFVYKQFYSLEIGTVNDSWRKYYTQYSPNFNFVVGGTSNSIGGYKASLTPISLITKLYFTTYKFERYGAYGFPTLAVPINYTSGSDDGTNSSYTYQSVNVPNEFCLGSSSASVYWTKSVIGSTTNTTSSFTLFYAGSNTILTMGEISQNDHGTDQVGQAFFNGYGIYHTNGLVNTNNGASWSKDGYYYWNGTSRTTSGSTSNAISVVGNGEPMTFIASQLHVGKAYPVVAIEKSYANSYSY